MEREDFYSITERYYSHFSCTDLSAPEEGVHFICSEKRDEVLKGYGCRFSVFILRKGNGICVTYSPKYRSFFEKTRGLPVDALFTAVSDRFALKVTKLLRFDSEKKTDTGTARVLTPADYSLYETFFRNANPNADPDGWLNEYFTEKAERGLFVGTIADGRLVSVCDAPDMPYMEGRIQHTGIFTIKEERGKGFGKKTAAFAAQNLIRRGICPQWDCDAGNTASLRTAYAAGYREYGTAYIVKES